MRNHFETESVAARYARGRPEFHAKIIESLCPPPGQRKFAAALDVGCGTGASTRPLTRIARRVIGLDPSMAMLAQAGRHPRRGFVAGRAEGLPFRTASFDLLTISSAFHWLDRERSLTEASRILGRPGQLVVYDIFITGRTEDGDEGIGPWLRDAFWRAYPLPPRSSVDFTAGEKVDPGFRCDVRDEYRISVEFTREGLVDYLVTLTNVIAAVEEGEEDIDEVRRWLLRQLAPFFHDTPSRRFAFEGPIWILHPE